MTNSIFVSIASAADKELIPTIKDLLYKADTPENITLSIFCQDLDSPELWVKDIVKRYNAKLIFEFMHIYDAKGVGYARRKTQDHLTEEYKYYLQIDSHTRFIESWDTLLVEEYEANKKYWGKYFFSGYPFNYYYDGNVWKFTKESHAVESMQVLRHESLYRYRGMGKKYEGDEHGEETGYFCGGFAFGYAKLFLKYKYHEDIFYNGEEMIQSILMHRDKVKLVVPTKNYVYHDYQGSIQGRRFSFFVDTDNKIYNEYKRRIDYIPMIEKSNNHLLEFYEGRIDGKFSQTLLDAYKSWHDKFTF